MAISAPLSRAYNIGQELGWGLDGAKVVEVVDVNIRKPYLFIFLGGEGKENSVDDDLSLSMYFWV